MCKQCHLIIKIRLIGYDKDLSLISIAGLGFGFELKQGFLYYAHFSIGSDSDSDPLIEMYVLGTEICPLKWVQYPFGKGIRI